MMQLKHGLHSGGLVSLLEWWHTARVDLLPAWIGGKGSNDGACGRGCARLHMLVAYGVEAVRKQARRQRP